jgi:hypothetical protein
MAIEYAVTAQIRGGRVNATLDGAPIGLGKLRASVAYDYCYDDRTNAINGASATVDRLSKETGLNMRFTTRGVADISSKSGKYCIIVNVYVVEEGAAR